MALALERHDAVIRDVVARCNGHVFKTVGDAFCCAFTRADDAVRAAMIVRVEIAAIDFSAVNGIVIRMAIHTGSATERDNDYFGPTLNRVARLLSVGHGGQILVSGTSAPLLVEDAAADVRLLDLGFHQLKDLGRPEHVYQIETGDKAVFPALRSISAVPHNLPAFASTFVGRTADLAEISARLHATRGLTICGTGGIGKTRCALAVAESELRAELQGVWLVEFASIADGKSVASAIAAVINVVVVPGADVLAAICDELAPKQVLLVLDNCEHIAYDVAVCAELMLRRCPGLRIIATSREALAYHGEVVYRLPSLSVPDEARGMTVERAMNYDAMKLFVDRATASGTKFELTTENVALVTEICRRLDGIALAIELAAMRLRSLSLSQLADGLKSRFRLLTGGSRISLPRQRTMRALIDWSYEPLTSQEQRFFRALAVFSGPFTIEASARLCEGDLREVDHFEMLASLVDKSLVERTIAEPTKHGTDAGQRYRIVDCLRAYAFEKLAETPEIGARYASLTRWAIDVVNDASVSWALTPSAEWESKFKPEFESIRAAIDWSTTDSGDLDMGRQIVARGRRLFGVIAPDEGLRCLQLILGSDDDSSSYTAELLVAEAQMNVALRRHAPALERAKGALRKMGSDVDAHLYHEARIVAGYSSAFFGDFTNSRLLLEEALDFFEKCNIRQWCGVIQSDLGVTYNLSSDDADARIWFLAALQSFKVTQNARGVRVLSINLAELDFRRGDVEVAIASLENAIRTGGGDDPLALANYAAYLIFANRFAEGLEFARESLILSTASSRDWYFGMQHVAAALCLPQGGVEPADRAVAAARLIGYVDCRLEATSGAREYTEAQEHVRIIKRLKEAIEPDILNALLTEGVALEHREALELALRT